MRKVFTSFILAAIMIFTVFFSGYTEIKSEAASTLRITTATFRKIPTIARNKTYRVTQKYGGFGNVKFKAPKSGKYVVTIRDLRYKKSANNRLNMCVTLYRYRSNKLLPVNFTGGAETWIVSKGYRRKYGGYTSCNFTLHLDKGQYLVIRTNALIYEHYDWKVTIK